MSKPLPPRPPERYRLSCEVTSNFYDIKGKPRIYGEKGETVKMITKGEVAIVEGKSGRFSVRLEKLIKIS